MKTKYDFICQWIPGKVLRRERCVYTLKRFRDENEMFFEERVCIGCLKANEKNRHHD